MPLPLSVADCSIEMNFYVFLFLNRLGGNFESILNESTYKIDMTLRIKSIGPNDFGSYKCIAKNSLGKYNNKLLIAMQFQCLFLPFLCNLLGETDSTIKLYSKLKYHKVSKTLSLFLLFSIVKFHLSIYFPFWTFFLLFFLLKITQNSLIFAANIS